MAANFANDIFKCIVLREHICLSIDIILKFVLKYPLDNKSSLVYVMLSHYLNQCLPRYLMPYGLTRPQGVNVFQLAIDKLAALFQTFSNASWRKRLYFDWHFIECCSWGCNWQKINVSSGSGWHWAEHGLPSLCQFTHKQLEMNGCLLPIKSVCRSLAR